MKLKKIGKILAGTIIFLTLPSLLFYGFLYFKYNEELPVGSQGEPADNLAKTMLKTLDNEAYKSTNYIEWTYKNRRHYEWFKSDSRCMVYWKDYKVDLNLLDYSKSKVYIHNFKIDNDLNEELINSAINYFNNDSFWLVAPYKIMDDGAERRIVSLDNGKKGLLVTYVSGGTTPGDSYLWHFDDNGYPSHFQMWTSVLPIDGLSASWSNWTKTESGAQLPTFHKILFFGFEIGDIKGTM